ncbi:MAG: hypothetical protein M1827_004490 [Pycnora praestabilis]|nr:MAG: hypothetical protein M1827_004490 [Pycnora praestabilis]
MSRPIASPSVLIIGSGTAGLTAALSARLSGAPSVLLIDKCPQTWSGGNGYFTAGAYRTVHNSLSSLLPIVRNVSAEQAGKIDLEPYGEEDFLADLRRVTGGRCDEALAEVLVGESWESVRWLAARGVKWELSFRRQSYEVDGRWKFWGGLALTVKDGGKGLVKDLQEAAEREGVDVWYETAATKILTNLPTGGVEGVMVQRGGTEREIRTRAIVLAAGGFEANPSMREKHLGPGWDKARVRGTPHNTGDLLQIAIRDVGAKTKGDWQGCHSVAWDANAPTDSGDREIGNEFTKSGYPLGLMLNTQGERFVDEGVDLRNYTYAKFGRAILEQPGGIAFQIWDSKTLPWLRDEEYRDARVRKIKADSISSLASQLAKDEGLGDSAKFTATIRQYNDAVHAHRRENADARFDPAVRDGLSTQSSTLSLSLPKSNWALPLSEPPFVAVKVSSGITFTFGGLEINPATAGVMSNRDIERAATGKEVPGLFCAGEMVGGLFYGNYPGGSGLTSGAVFGRRAGRGAAEWAEKTVGVGREGGRGGHDMVGSEVEKGEGGLCKGVNRAVL